MPNRSEIQQQSENAYNQWASQWRIHAGKHKRFQMKSLEDFNNIGIGKACLCVANGYSLQREIETIKQFQSNVDILACDKTLGHLLNNGIIPQYVLLCDANVSYEKYMKPYEDQLQNTILFSNVCANPEWTHNGNWKDIYFFVNKDILESEKEFAGLSGCTNLIPAATNVSNAQVVFLTQADEKGNNNFFGYDKIILIGFDYGFKDNKYYAFNPEGDGKNNYMRHVQLLDNENDLFYTSNNLMFSSRWLHKYIQAFNLPVVQCSWGSILNLGATKHLVDQMQYSFRPKDSELVRELITQREKVLKVIKDIKNKLNFISDKHFEAYQASI